MEGSNLNNVSIFFVACYSSHRFFFVIILTIRLSSQFFKTLHMLGTDVEAKCPCFKVSGFSEISIIPDLPGPYLMNVDSLNFISFYSKAHSLYVVSYAAMENVLNVHCVANFQLI